MVKINIDENPQVVAALGAQSILLVIGFRNGEAVSRFLGVQPAGMIRGFLDELVPSQLEQYVVSAGQELEADELDDCQSLLAQAELIDTEHEAVRLCHAGLLIARQQPDAAIKVLSSIPSNGHNDVARLLSRARLMSALLIQITRNSRLLSIKMILTASLPMAWPSPVAATMKKRWKSCSAQSERSLTGTMERYEKRC